MTTEEAKFILSGFRPNGSDSGEDVFRNPLKMAADDPELGSWLGRARAHDSAVAAGLRQIVPPPGLREAILAGARVSGARRSGWPARLAWVGMAAAAAVALLAALRWTGRPQSASSTFAQFAIEDMDRGNHGGRGEPTRVLTTALETEGARMPGAEQIDFEKLRESGCRTLSLGGHDVIEVCFTRDGSLFHFYVTRRDGSLGDAMPRGPLFVSRSDGEAAVWSDERFDYALATTAGMEALKRLL